MTAESINFYIAGHPASGINAVRDCDGCFACCMKAGSPPFETREELDSIPKHLRRELERYFSKIEKNEIQSRSVLFLPCLWLDEEKGECTNYDYRPKICRDFQVGGQECIQFIDLGLPPDNPGEP